MKTKTSFYDKQFKLYLLILGICGGVYDINASGANHNISSTSDHQVASRPAYMFRFSPGLKTGLELVNTALNAMPLEIFNGTGPITGVNTETGKKMWIDTLGDRALLSIKPPLLYYQITLKPVSSNMGVEDLTQGDISYYYPVYYSNRLICGVDVTRGSDLTRGTATGEYAAIMSELSAFDGLHMIEQTLTDLSQMKQVRARQYEPRLLVLDRIFAVWLKSDDKNEDFVYILSDWNGEFRVGQLYTNEEFVKKVNGLYIKVQKDISARSSTPSGGMLAPGSVPVEFDNKKM